MPALAPDRAHGYLSQRCGSHDDHDRHTRPDTPEIAGHVRPAPLPELRRAAARAALLPLRPAGDRLVRHFTSIIGDFLDTVLNIDARVFRTLWPLFAKPAYLSCEYFAGRRVRYVSPVRLFVFLSIVTFFVARMTLSVSGHPIQFGDDDAIASATSVAAGREIARRVDRRTGDWSQARSRGARPGCRTRERAGGKCATAPMRASPKSRTPRPVAKRRQNQNPTSPSAKASRGTRRRIRW